MAKRRSSGKWWEKLIIAVCCVIAAAITGLYVWLTFRAVTTEQRAAEATDKYFSILYVDYDDTLILSDFYGEGYTRQTPAEPTREGYIFTGWKSETSPTIYSTQMTLSLAVVDDMCFKATYEPIMYTVKYLDSDYSILSTLKYTKDESIPEIDNPTKEGYIFTGWDSATNGDTITRVAMYVDETSDYICRVGNTYYTDLQEAVDAIPLLEYDLSDEEIHDRYYRTRDLYLGDEEELDLLYYEDIIIHLFRDISLSETIIFCPDEAPTKWGGFQQAGVLNLIDDVTISYTKATGNLFEIEAFNLLFNTNKYTLTLNNPVGYAIKTISAFDTSFRGYTKVLGQGIHLNNDNLLTHSEHINLFGVLDSNINIKYYSTKSDDGSKTYFDGAFILFGNETSAQSKINVILTLDGVSASEDTFVFYSELKLEDLSVKVYDAAKENLYTLIRKYKVETNHITGLTEEYYIWYPGEKIDIPYTTLTTTSQVITTDITEQSTMVEEFCPFNARYLDTTISSEYNEVKLYISGTAVSVEDSSTSTKEEVLVLTKGYDGIYRTNITEVEYISSMTIELTAIKPTLMITVQGNGEWYYETLTITKIEAR